MFDLELNIISDDLVKWRFYTAVVASPSTAVHWRGKPNTENGLGVDQRSDLQNMAQYGYSLSQFLTRTALGEG